MTPTARSELLTPTGSTFIVVDPDWPSPNLCHFGRTLPSRCGVAELEKRIKARAVSANTDSATRRRVVEEFRAGDVKALVNYGDIPRGI